MPRRRPLPWPCSRIERDVLHQLWCEAKRSGQPITAIVTEAVNQHLNARLADAASAASSQPLVTA